MDALKSPSHTITRVRQPKKQNIQSNLHFSIGVISTLIMVVFKNTNSEAVVQNLGLKTEPHPNPYKDWVDQERGRSKSHTGLHIYYSYEVVYGYCSV